MCSDVYFDVYFNVYGINQSFNCYLQLCFTKNSSNPNCELRMKCFCCIRRFPSQLSVGLLNKCFFYYLTLFSSIVDTPWSLPALDGILIEIIHLLLLNVNTRDRLVTISVEFIETKRNLLKKNAQRAPICIPIPDKSKPPG